MEPSLGVIAGTGFEPLLTAGVRRRFSSPFGRFDYFERTVGGIRVVMIPRHGFGHQHSPFRMPTRAHVLALKILGVGTVLGTSSVGSANIEVEPGDVVIPDQFIDLTGSRATTFYDFDETVHTDMSVPFCDSVRAEVEKAARSCSPTNVHCKAVYVATEGPRFQTPAEIEMIRRIGGHIVGQSAAAEAVLSRELGICYALLAVASSFAAGLQQRKDSRSILESIWSRREWLERVVLDSIAAVSVRTESDHCRANEIEASRLFSRLRQLMRSGHVQMSPRP